MCGNCGHEYKIKEGIANFLLPSHLGESELFAFLSRKRLWLVNWGWRFCLGGALEGDGILFLAEEDKG